MKLSSILCCCIIILRYALAYCSLEVCPMLFVLAIRLASLFHCHSVTHTHTHTRARARVRPHSVSQTDHLHNPIFFLLIAEKSTPVQEKENISEDWTPEEFAPLSSLFGNRSTVKIEVEPDQDCGPSLGHNEEQETADHSQRRRRKQVAPRQRYRRCSDSDPDTDENLECELESRYSGEGTKA